MLNIFPINAPLHIVCTSPMYCIQGEESTVVPVNQQGLCMHSNESGDQASTWASLHTLRTGNFPRLPNSSVATQDWLTAHSHQLVFCFVFVLGCFSLTFSSLPALVAWLLCSVSVSFNAVGSYHLFRKNKKTNLYTVVGGIARSSTARSQ